MIELLGKEQEEEEVVVVGVEMGQVQIPGSNKGLEDRDDRQVGEAEQAVVPVAHLARWEVEEPHVPHLEVEVEVEVVELTFPFGQLGAADENDSP